MGASRRQVAPVSTEINGINEATASTVRSSETRFETRVVGRTERFAGPLCSTWNATRTGR